mmetsp:Transcript_38678/g.116890  ORF Transcript_38678/g.116890 Transcript_38678/m.116890 type:complete len:241 (-) Transcript_38678:2-724(-)
MNPRSNFMPSTTSSSCSMVLPSATVMVPSLPTRSKASATMPPILASPFAEIVATCRISSGLEIGVAICSRSERTDLTAASMPRFRSMGFMPATTALVPSRRIARASTVDVVVPSPAMSLVFEATCLMREAPMLTARFSNSMAFATVTPSLVTFGAPKLCSITTLRPLGPRVTATASASLFAPDSMAARASAPCLISLVAKLRRPAAAAAALRARRVESMAAAGAPGRAIARAIGRAIARA